MGGSARQREHPLQVIGDVRLDLLWRHTRIEGRDGHNRQLNRRKHIHWHVGSAYDAKNHYQKAKNHNQIRVTYSKSRHSESFPYLGGEISNEAVRLRLAMAACIGLV